MADMRNPGARWGATGALEGVQRDGSNDFEDSPSPLELQLSHLRRHFGITGHRARLIADLAFGSEVAA